MKNDAKTTKTTELQQVAVSDVTTFSGEAERLISQAIDKNVPVEALERLLAMRREFRADKAQEEYNHAMASFQAQCPTIQKRKKVSFGGGGYSYAPLEDIVSQVRELLSVNGFSYTFDTKKTERSLTTFCKVKHIGGHSETSEFEIAIDTNSKMNISQKDGAASSYGKRYAFCNAFGILTGDEDTDTHEYKPSIKQQLTMPPTEKPIQNSLIETPAAPMITPEQKSEILDVVYQTGRSRMELDAFLNDAYGRTLERLTKDQAYKVIGRLQKEGKKTVTPEVEITEEDLNKMAASIN